MWDVLVDLLRFRRGEVALLEHREHQPRRVDQHHQAGALAHRIHGGEQRHRGLEVEGLARDLPQRWCDPDADLDAVLGAFGGDGLEVGFLARQQELEVQILHFAVPTRRQGSEDFVQTAGGEEHDSCFCGQASVQVCGF